MSHRTWPYRNRVCSFLFFPFGYCFCLKLKSLLPFRWNYSQQPPTVEDGGKRDQLPPLGQWEHEKSEKTEAAISYETLHLEANEQAKDLAKVFSFFFFFFFTSHLFIPLLSSCFFPSYLSFLVRRRDIQRWVDRWEDSHWRSGYSRSSLYFH